MRYPPPHPGRECPAGQAPALLESSANGCAYAECGKASALEQPADAGSLPSNAAAMAAPAIVLTVIVVAFVEILMHFC